MPTEFERDCRFSPGSPLLESELPTGEAMEKRGYYVQGVLGEGGFGKVYLAEFRGEAQFTRPVAVKLLTPRPDMHPEIERRLRDEGRILGQLHHPNIVQAIDITRLQERWAVVMEFVAGADLASLQARVGPLPLGPALEIAAEVADALHQAHTQLALIHRDVKPQNIRLTPHGKIKVLDFGIARAVFPEREARTSGHFYGTPSYTAPERFEQGDVPESDVYSLAVVLYELVAGTSFGKASGDPVKHRSNLEQRLERLRQGGVSDEVVSFLRTSLAHDPNHRPSARAFKQTAMQLCRAHGALSLSDWAEQVQHLLPSQPPLDTDDLCGRVLTARTSTLEYREPLDSVEISAAPSISLGAGTPRRVPHKGLIAGGVLLLTGAGFFATVLLAALGASWFGGWWERPEEPAPAPVPEPVPAVVPLPVPRPEPNPAQPVEKPVEAPVEPPPAQIRSEGFPIEVTDLGTGRPADPAALAPGTYLIVAHPHGKLLRVGEIELRAGERHRVRCDPDLSLPRCWLVKEER